jgi:hypothetical protein
MTREQKRLMKAKEAVQDNLAVVKSMAREQKKRLKAGLADEATKDGLAGLQSDVQALSERRGALDQVIAQEKAPR